MVIAQVVCIASRVCAVKGAMKPSQLEGSNPSPSTTLPHFHSTEDPT